jgi:integrase
VQGKRCWFVDLKAEVVKNLMTRSHELPPESSPLIDEAMRLYAQSNDWIFPGRKGGRKLSGTLGPQIKRAVESRLGVPFNTHLYRAIAGCTHLKENPDGFESARALLGDRDDRVLRENYLFLSERHLIRHAQQSIKTARVRLAPRSVRKRKK